MNSLPVLILGFRRALVKSVTDIPVSLEIFCALVLSGRRAWSEFLSCLNLRLPKCSTADTTRKMAGEKEGVRERGHTLLLTMHTKKTFSTEQRNTEKRRLDQERCFSDAVASADKSGYW